MANIMMRYLCAREEIDSTSMFSLKLSFTTHSPENGENLKASLPRRWQYKPQLNRIEGCLRE